MPFAQTLTNQQEGRRKRDGRNKERSVVTETVEQIVTALAGGEATARDLSQRLDKLEYANIRQTLGRMAKAGIVTKPRRGVYALSHCDNDTGAKTADDEPANCDKPVRPLPKPQPDPDRQHRIARAVKAAWAHFHATNNPYDERAWA